MSVAGRVREPTSVRSSSSLSCIKRTLRFSKWVMRRRTRRFKRSSSRSISLSSSSILLPPAVSKLRGTTILPYGRAHVFAST